MMRNVERYVFPANLKEAILLLGEGAGTAAAVAGGTVLSTTRPSHVRTLVDISRLGLCGVTTSSEGIRIGACTTLQEMVQPTPLGGYLHGIIPEAAFSTTSHILRNATTLGGNLVTLRPATQLATALLAADATLTLDGPGGSSRLVPLDDFLVRRQELLAPGILLTSIHLPRAPRFTSAAFEKLAQVHQDPGVVSVAARITLKNRLATEVRLAVGSGCPHPLRCRGAEATLEGSPLDEATMGTALEALRAELPLQPDLRASAEYRIEMALVLASRALRRAFDLATGEL